MEGKRSEKVTAKQRDIMVDFMYEHKEFSKNKLLSPEGRVTSNHLWVMLCTQLNSVGPEKSLQKWQRVWTDIKVKIRRKKKASMQAASRRRTGGRPMDKIRFSDHEIKVLELISKSTVFVLSGPDGISLDSPDPVILPCSQSPSHQITSHTSASPGHTSTSNRPLTPLSSPRNSAANRDWDTFVKDEEIDYPLTREKNEVVSPVVQSLEETNADASATPERTAWNETAAKEPSDQLTTIAVETLNTVRDISSQMNILNSSLDAMVEGQRESNRLRGETNQLLQKLILSMEKN